MEIRENMGMIVELIDEKRYKEAMALVRESFEGLKTLILYLGENNIIEINELTQLSENLVSSIENEDMFLLRDIMKYALISVYDQLFTEEGIDVQN